MKKDLGAGHEVMSVDKPEESVKQILNLGGVANQS